MKTEMVITFVFFSLVIVPGALAQTPAILDMVLTDQSPYPVNPGETVTIEVQIQNTGYAQALDRTVEIVPKDPFSLLPGEEREQTVATITPRGSYSLTYRLAVSGTAPTNSYPVDFRIYTGADRSVFTEDFVDVNVEGEANLVLDDLYTNPETLEPGAIADVVVKVKNIGTGTARDLQLTLNSTHDEIKQVLAKGKVYVGDLKAGETKTATLGMSVDSTAEEKTYNVLIFADYKDESNTDTTDSFSIGLPVKGTISLDIIKKEASFERGTLRIEVANKGTTEAKSLEAKLEVDGNTVGIDYISSLKANKKTTFEFPLVLKGSGQLVMDYIGPGIDKNQVVKEIVMDYEAPSQGDGTTTLVIVVVVIIIVYFLYRKFFKKKKPKHHHEHEHK
jgi:hypothetical protein